MKKILIIDDDIANIKLLSNALSQTYQIIASTDGEESIATATKQKPDLILLDIIMPGMDGYKTLEKLKNNPETADIPVIFITGLQCSGYEEYGINLGARDYISKPFNIGVVKARIKTQLDIIEHTKAYEYLAKHDLLTHTNNRLAITELCQHTLNNENNVVILFVDLDKFKAINDNYGHQAGDNVLKEIVARLNTFLSNLDSQPNYLGRMGGDEFLIVLSNIDDVAKIEQICIKLIKTIENAIDIGFNTNIIVSASIGAVMASANQSIDTMINNADELMYLAKRNANKRYYIQRQRDQY